MENQSIPHNASSDQVSGQTASGVKTSSKISGKTNKKGFLEVNGEVIEALPNVQFRVMLENGREILGVLSGKMRMHRIMLMPGDQVKIELSPYDVSKGRIVFRY